MIINSQKSVTEIPELKGSTRYVETRDFFRDGSVSPRPIRYHWCCNAETYWLIGESMGNRCLKFEEKIIVRKIYPLILKEIIMLKFTSTTKGLILTTLIVVASIGCGLFT